MIIHFEIEYIELHLQYELMSLFILFGGSMSCRHCELNSDTIQFIELVATEFYL